MAPSAPTIVLVPGAFVDAGGWAPVVELLLAEALRVVVPALEYRSLAADAATVRSCIDGVGGPVLLVGHCYGGAVATVAGTHAAVVGLVYVAGHALDVGESITSLEGTFDDAGLGDHLVREERAGSVHGTQTSLTVSVDRFPDVVADGLQLEIARILAVSQRPVAAQALDERSDRAAWRTTPTWGVVARDDQVVSPALQRHVYARAGARAVVELDGPHLVMHTHPLDVVEVLRAALGDLDRSWATRSHHLTHPAR
ncbi:pimeloyl-ACP methyl ester carboxylesterase [Sediminihabitans luteus]|uniref:Pimeloyl-ACP methyl ester carboxylesterase n=1 Tax=Sediminihabitans luteus TaxID=1138585 RepID=A0A2M9CQL3_9CELL|nr:alpha/beta hydrolase [Sediminihabitans luteus]PJJ74194.1 pimeloyl-ACP methyl ester carboxylesterase [Sediminihabitans luteus]GII99047.1 alpha/beta hydrolase [Sediminihabitans luteus]